MLAAQKLGRELGEKQPLCCEKFLTGILLFAGLVVLLFLPLIIFSDLNPILQPNPVAHGTATIMVPGTAALYGAYVPSLSPVSATLNATVFAEIAQGLNVVDCGGWEGWDFG